jgi:hypothetical protein
MLVRGMATPSSWCRRGEEDGTADHGVAPKSFLEAMLSARDSALDTAREGEDEMMGIGG